MSCACRRAHHWRIALCGLRLLNGSSRGFAPIGLSVSKARTVGAVSEAVTFADLWFDKLTTNVLLLAAWACRRLTTKGLCRGLAFVLFT
jgi:hypothetical protein